MYNKQLQRHSALTYFLLNHFLSPARLSSFINNQDQFSFKPIDREKLLKLLLSIDADSAPGASHLESSIIKHCANEIVDSLLFVFNLAINSNTILDEWKISFVTPVLKPKSLDSYIPISVLHQFLKFLKET